jgi:endonuclease/exonuclease/phosphatase (EEP) superfamily protein YafD
MRWLDRLLVLCAALVVAANLLPLGARLSWVLELTTHFRVQYLAATAVLLVLLALRRKWRACVVLAAAGVVSAAAVLPYLPLAAAAQPVAAATAARLKVLTVNVSFRQFSARRLLELVRQENPDILVLQELTPHAETVLKDFDTAFPFNRKFPADGAYGIGLWSRLELESGQTIAIGRVPAIEARVRGPTGVFTVIGVHLSAPTTPRRAAARRQQLLELAARSAAVAGPLVVAGDFNVTPYSPYFVEWLQTSGLTDSRRGRTLSVSWPTMLPWAGVPIDHVAVNTDFTILSHRRLPNFESDHYGVLVELALRGGHGGERP